MQMIEACSRPFDDSRRNSEGRFGRSGRSDSDESGEPNMRPKNSIAATTANTEDGDREVRWECSQCSTAMGNLAARSSLFFMLAAASPVLRCTSSKRRRRR